MYHQGQGTARDYAKAIKWYRIAAAQDFARAQFNLGVMYDRGQGTPQDYATAIKWYRAAAEQGDADAQFNLGFMYHRAKARPEDYAQAIKWYRAAAEQGDVEAQYTAGEMYRDSQGTPQDFLRAYAYFSVAAANGHSDAWSERDRLGRKLGPEAILKAQALAHGLGYAEHAHLGAAEKNRPHQAAAEKGNADAQFNLGVMYANGEGMPQVFLQVYAHQHCGSKWPQEGWVGMRDKVAKKLAPEGVLKAQALARTLWESWKTQ